MRSSIFLTFLILTLSVCKGPKMSNACDPNSKDYLETKLILQALDLPFGNTPCLTYSRAGDIIVTPLFPLGKMLRRDTALEFSFNHVVNSDRCTFTLGIGGDSFSKRYEKLTERTSKVVLTPNSRFAGGVDRELGIFCTTEAGNSTKETYVARYSFGDGFRYVSPSGSDGNSGFTESEALLTIQQGIARLSSSSDCDSVGEMCFVLVAKGDYTTSSTITPLNRISIFGSYNNDFLTRNADPNSTTYTPTTITDTRISTGGGISNPISTFTITGSLSKDATEINGLHIKSPTTGTGFSAGVSFTSITDTGIIFRSNKIEIQNPGSAFGIYADASTSGDVISNLITQTGTYSGNSWNGIYLNSNGSAFATIDSNTITQGICGGASCIMSGIASNSTGGATLITKNIINLGNASANNGSVNGFYPFCSVSTPTMTFSNNTIKGTNCTGSGCTISGLNLSVSALTNKLAISSNDINPGSCTVGSCTTRGIYITGNNSTDVDFTSNIIAGGDASATTSGTAYGFINDTGVSSFINFKNNTITTGKVSSAGITVGMRIGALGSGSGDISGNTVSGGSGNLVFALWGSPSSNITIQRNRFIGGTSSSSGNSTIDINLGNRFLSNLVIAGSESTGPNTAVKISGGSSQFYHNTLIGRGTGTFAYGLQMSATNSVDVGYNLIVTESGAASRYCVSEDSNAHGVNSFVNNALWDCPGAYYNDLSTASPLKTNWCSNNGGTFSIAVCTSEITNPLGTNNISPVNPIFSSTANNKYCLSTSSPSAITTGAATNLVTTDLTGATRPTGNRAIGAYEPGSLCD
ncbi:MAG: hypothetical protein O9264_11725 [Leptospira sp.]|nr:hypothetical protein [Leptospira sp.]